MSVTELEKIATRLYALVNEAWEFGQDRSTILAIVEEYANDLQDEADEIAEAMARDYEAA